MRVMGFSGKARHGKDTCAEIARQIALEEFDLNIAGWAFAHPLKATVYGEYKGRHTLEEIFHTKPPEVREILQKRGTEGGRNVYGQGLWTLQTEAYLKVFAEHFPIDGVTITDVRFPNEVLFCRAGGIDVETFFVRETEKMADELGLPDEDPLDDVEFSRQLDLESGMAWQVGDKVLDLLDSGDGMALYIQSDRPTLTGEAAQHLSETALDDTDKEAFFDGVIINNLDTTFEDLREQLRPYVRTLFDL